MTSGPRASLMRSIRNLESSNCAVGYARIDDQCREQVLCFDLHADLTVEREVHRRVAHDFQCDDMDAPFVDLGPTPEREVGVDRERESHATPIESTQLLDADLQLVVRVGELYFVVLPDTVLDGLVATLDVEVLELQARDDLFPLAPVFASLILGRDRSTDQFGKGIGQCPAGGGWGVDIDCE